MTDRQILNRNLAQMLKGGVIMAVSYTHLTLPTIA